MKEKLFVNDDTLHHTSYEINERRRGGKEKMEGRVEEVNRSIRGEVERRIVVVVVCDGRRDDEDK